MQALGVFTCLILASVKTILGKYCDGNSYKYYTWKICSHGRAIIASIATILARFQAISKRIPVSIIFGCSFLQILTFEVGQNCLKTCKYCDNTCKYYTGSWTHFSSIGSILISIITIHPCSVWLLGLFILSKMGTF